MTKKITKQEEAQLKIEHEAKKAKLGNAFKRGFFVVLFAGTAATAVFLGTLIVDREVGHYILAAFNALSATVFFILAIK